MLNIMINKTINEPMFYFYYPTIKLPADSCGAI